MNQSNFCTSYFQVIFDSWIKIRPYKSVLNIIVKYSVSNFIPIIKIGGKGQDTGVVMATTASFCFKFSFESRISLHCLENIIHDSKRDYVCLDCRKWWNESSQILSSASDCAVSKPAQCSSLLTLFCLVSWQRPSI